jgi:hypothetical protein
MITNQGQKNNNMYVLGFKSKFAELVFNHPWCFTFLVFIVTGCIIFYVEDNIEKVILAMKVLSLPLFGTTTLVRIFQRNTCYKVVIDTKREIAIFHLMFNQGIVEAKTRRIKVIIVRHFNCITDGRTFVLMNNLLHDVVALLPESTEIKFVGFFGRHWEKELIKTKRLPKGGQKKK